jgi:hypothetical protein
MGATNFLVQTPTMDPGLRRDDVFNMELQQSPLFKKYIELLKWKVETVEEQNVFIKRFPLIGSLAKIQRAYPLPNINNLLPIIQQYGIKRFVVEASEREEERVLREWVEKLKQYVSIISSPYLPSKTIRIDLTQSEEKIFKSFTEAKQRGVRRAKKNNIQVVQQDRIDQLIEIKNRSAGFLGFITTSGLKELWQAFGKENATTILAYASSSLRGNPAKRDDRGNPVGENETDSSLTPCNDKLIAGILLLFWEDISYYWIAGATKEGKKLFAPTLLAWEAIKIAKQRGAKWFDWVGVWDERFPKENSEWKGFTKFKEGFGGKAVYYPTHRK